MFLISWEQIADPDLGVMVRGEHTFARVARVVLYVDLLLIFVTL